MASLTKAQPPAWALGASDVLNSIAAQEQILEDQYLAQKIVQQEAGAAALASGQFAKGICDKEAQGLYSAAGGQMAGNGVSLLGIGISGIVAGKATMSAEYTKTQTALDNVNKWDEEIKKVALTKPDIEMTMVGGQKGDIESDSIRSADGTQLFDPNETPDQIAALYGNSPPCKKDSDFNKLADKVAKNKELLEKKIDGFQSNARRIEERFTVVSNGLSGLAQASGQVGQAAYKAQEKWLQLNAKLADYNSSTLNAAQSVMAQAANNTMSQMNNAAETLKAVAASNQVA